MSVGFLPHCSVRRWHFWDPLNNTQLIHILPAFILFIRSFFLFFMKSNSHVFCPPQNMCGHLHECFQSLLSSSWFPWLMNVLRLNGWWLAWTFHSDWLSRHDAVPAAKVETCLIKKGSFNVLVVGPNSFYFRHVFWCPGGSLRKRITTHSVMKHTKLTHSVAGMQRSTQTVVQSVVGIKFLQVDLSSFYQPSGWPLDWHTPWSSTGLLKYGVHFGCWSKSFQ